MDVLGKIRLEYSELSKANKRLADYFLQNSDQIIGHTAQEIGEAAGVSPASVIRFVKKIGYAGLDEVKVQLAAEYGTATVDKKVDPIVSKTDTLDDLCLKVKTLIDETTTDVFDLTDMPNLERGIELIRKAQTIYLFEIGRAHV